MHISRRFKLLAVSTVAALGLAGGLATSAQAATQASICVGSNGAGLCLNDWNGATTGPIKMFAHGAVNDSFTPQFLTGYCSGGRVNSTCPFWVGSGWNTQLTGGAIVQIKSNVNGRCIGTDFSGNLDIGPCPPTSGGGGSNIWVEMAIPGCTAAGDLALVSVYWINHNHDAVPNNDIVYAFGGSGSQPFVGGGGSNSATCFRYANQ
jgi:hypothetical protein